MKRRSVFAVVASAFVAIATSAYGRIAKRPRFRKWTITFRDTQGVNSATLQAIMDRVVIDEGEAGRLAGVNQSFRFYVRHEHAGEVR